MAVALSPLLAATVDTSNTVGWQVGYVVTIVVVVVVVALVVPILVLAYRIGNQAKDDQRLAEGLGPQHGRPGRAAHHHPATPRSSPPA